MADIIGVGSSVYDTLMLLDHYPMEDTKMQGVRTLVQGGGPCATGLAAAARLGIDTAYMGTVGDDPFGRFLVEDLRRCGVSVAYLREVPGALSFHSVVLLNRENASRTCIWNAGTVPAPAPEELNADALRAAKVLHLDGHMLEAAIHAAVLVREAGGKVSHDAGGVYPGIERLLPHVDFLVPSEEFALKMTGARDAETAARRLFDTYGPELVLITQGAGGGLLYQGREMRRYPAFPVEAVDTNGAGDTFHGAFIAGYVKGLSMMDCALYASAASALKCTGLGARASMPDDARVRAFLRERGVELAG